MNELKSLTLPELTETLRAMGEPAFRGKQVFTWLHKGITSYVERIRGLQLPPEIFGNIPHFVEIGRAHV